jgi:hypothetical protein
MNFHQLESGSNEIEYCITVYTISYSSPADDGLEVISAGQSRSLTFFLGSKAEIDEWIYISFGILFFVFFQSRLLCCFVAMFC